MLALAIITTILEILVLIDKVKIFADIFDSSHPIAASIGGLIGIAIKCIPIITVWVFYNHLA